MLDALGEEARQAVIQKGQKFHVDLKLCNRLWLRRAGVEIIEVSSECTACNTDRYWSHRGHKGIRGTQTAIIML